ncbi:uncharacterized protein SPSK_03720 [Sporothrix schenckii 1099-18]|uniref:Uncharacterized protein n=1 Tax=Sporothrix schenckii 1099-18 TaxID=1397361 RepID=A0A0F2M0M3_SPOSC|nr:uncharacterized protein SPSK_03720 [Sporothrix schenckii 1099-18]KJR82310.1 hypothetical protein SPSK_03720 [Sporothrix schenckii 1099-18]
MAKTSAMRRGDGIHNVGNGDGKQAPSQRTVLACTSGRREVCSVKQRYHGGEAQDGGGGEAVSMEEQKKRDHEYRCDGQRDMNVARSQDGPQDEECQQPKRRAKGLRAGETTKKPKSAKITMRLRVSKAKRKR